MRCRILESTLTVNDEDLRITCGCIRDVQEMNVVLGKSHHGLVGGVIWGCLGIDPGECGGVGSFEVTHVEEEDFAV